MLYHLYEEEDIFTMSQYSEFYEDNEHNDIVAINVHCLARICLWTIKYFLLYIPKAIQ